jgi:hypothetical protein
MSDYVIPEPEPKEVDEKLSDRAASPCLQRGVEG